MAQTQPTDPAQPLKGKEFRGRYRKVSGRYRIIFKPTHATRTVGSMMGGGPRGVRGGMAYRLEPNTVSLMFADGLKTAPSRSRLGKWLIAKER